MTVVTTDALVPVLEDARDAHTAVIDCLRADMAVHAAGPRREVVQRHIDATHDCVARIEGYMRELRPRHRLRDATDKGRFIARTTVRTAGLLLEIGAAITTAILHRRNGPSTRQVMRHTENEYALTARALAACRTGERIVEQTHDQVAADLLATLRSHDEKLLATLEDSLAQQARATKATGSGEPGDGGPPDAATSTLRPAVRKAAEGGGRQATRSATGALRQMPENDEDAITGEEEPPILGYQHFRVADIIQRLPTLSQAQLSALDGYERAHAGRPEILNTIERLRGSEPWPGYDTMLPDQITTRLQTATPAEARQVLDYEGSHRRRGTLIGLAKARSIT
ncbi:hypothetical protein [Streptomyces phaeoluteigriseus]